MDNSNPLNSGSPISSERTSYSAETKSVSPKQVATPSTVKNVAVPVIEKSNSQQAVDSSTLQGKKISTDSQGWRQKLVSVKEGLTTFTELLGFFPRSENVEKAKTNLEQITKHLDTARAIRSRAQEAEDKIFSGTYPSKNTINGHEGLLTHIIEERDKAVKLFLETEQVLQQIKSEAGSQNRPKVKENLNKEHTELTKDLKTLENLIDVLNHNIRVRQEILKLEKEMKKYIDDGATWNGFKAVGKAREELGNALKTLLPKDSKNKKIEPYCTKESLTAEDIYQLTKQAYPSFTGHIERLLDSTLAITDRRMWNLKNKKIKSLENDIASYRNSAVNVQKIEEKLNLLTSPSVAGWFYRGFAKVVGITVSGTKEELAQANKARANIASQIKDTFNDEEIQWLGRVQSDSTAKKLKTKIDYLRNVRIPHLQAREKLSLEIDQLNLSLKKTGAEEFRTIIPELAQSIKELKNIVIASGETLPRNFDELTPLEQLKALINTSHTALKPKIEFLFKLTEKRNLKDTLNTELKKALKSQPALSVARDEQPIPPVQENEQDAPNDVIPASTKTILSPKNPDVISPSPISQESISNLPPPPEVPALTENWDLTNVPLPPPIDVELLVEQEIPEAPPPPPETFTNPDDTVEKNYNRLTEQQELSEDRSNLLKSITQKPQLRKTSTPQIGKQVKKNHLEKRIEERRAKIREDEDELEETDFEDEDWFGPSVPDPNTASKKSTNQQITPPTTTPSSKNNKTAEQTKTKVPSQPVKPQNSTSARSALLEAIRVGKDLRKTPKPPEKKVVPSSGNKVTPSSGNPVADILSRAIPTTTDDDDEEEEEGMSEDWL